jgi:hypothetical protein
MKTVFFGPFVGEFGWELLAWQGWVRKVCRNEYKDYHKIVCSFPGHYPLYPDTDEYIPLPQWLVDTKLPARAYITDCWIGDLPHAHNPIYIALGY